VEGGAGGRGEEGPEEGVVVAREVAAEEDGGHGAALGVRGGVEEMGQAQKEGLRAGLLAEVE